MSPRDPLAEHYYHNLVVPLWKSGLLAVEVDFTPGLARTKREYTGETNVASAELVEGWRLSLYETARIGDDGHSVEKGRYRYNVIDNNGITVVRYDNSPHHKALPHFPHHRHDGPDEIPAPNPDHSFEAFLRDVSAYMDSGKYLEKRHTNR